MLEDPLGAYIAFSYVGCLMFLVYVWGPHNMDVQLQSFYFFCITFVQDVHYPSKLSNDNDKEYKKRFNLVCYNQLR